MRSHRPPAGCGPGLLPSTPRAASGAARSILKTCDDREDRSRALECARELIEQDKVFALVATNTRALGGAAQYINDKGVPTIGIPITNSFYRYPHFWSGYPTGYRPRRQDRRLQGPDHEPLGRLPVVQGEPRRDEGRGVHLRHRRVEAGRRPSSRRAWSSRGSRRSASTWCPSPPRASTRPSRTCRAAAPRSSSTAWTTAPTASCATRWRAASSSRTAKVSTIVSMGDSVGNDYNDTCRNVGVHHGRLAPVHRHERPGDRDFRAAFAKYQPGKPLHQWALEAWGQATLVADAVTSMGAAPTRKGLEDYFRGLNKYTAGGMHDRSRLSRPRLLARPPTRTASPSPDGSTPRAAGYRPRSGSPSATRMPTSSRLLRSNRATDPTRCRPRPREVTQALDLG